MRESECCFVTFTIWNIIANLASTLDRLIEHISLGIQVLCIGWVSVVEFHDGALGIGKVFGQDSTVIKWNYQILGLYQVTVRQKLGVILVTKWFKT